MFLYWKQVSHSSANCTLRLLNAVVIIVIWICSSHSKPTRSRLRWRMEMRRCIIRQNLTSSTASRGKQKLYRMVQRKQTPSSSTIAWFKTAANLFTSWMLEERELSSSSRRDYSWSIFRWSCEKCHGLTLSGTHTDRCLSRGTHVTSVFAWK